LSDEVFTIGHSDLGVETFIAHLQLNHISAIVDVRSSPYSRMQPQFNREALKRDLQKNNISYLFFGKELGARSEQPECYINGRVQFDILATQPLFLEGIDRIIKGTFQYCIALMCSEKDPLNCHRTILVARQLCNRGIGIKHILYDGSIELHYDLEKRLLKKLKMEELDLFRSESEIVSDAYSKWSDRIAYVDESTDNEGWET
jgi:uncharacterized protein (DUF488 family)